MGKKQRPPSPIDDRKTLRYFDARIAVKLGLKEAIILQQIDYWIKSAEKNETNYHDGYYWTFNSIPGWAKQFPFWSEKTTERILKDLRETGCLIVTNEYNRRNNDNTLWYRIVYDKLDEIITNELHTPRQNVVAIPDKLTGWEDIKIEEQPRQNDVDDLPNLTLPTTTICRPPSPQNDVSDHDKMTRALPIDTYIDTPIVSPIDLPIETTLCQNQQKFEPENKPEAELPEDEIIMLDKDSHSFLPIWQFVCGQAYSGIIPKGKSIDAIPIQVKKSDIPSLLDMLDGLKAADYNAGDFNSKAREYVKDRDFKDVDLFQFVFSLHEQVCKPTEDLPEVDLSMFEDFDTAERGEV